MTELLEVIEGPPQEIICTRELHRLIRETLAVLPNAPELQGDLISLCDKYAEASCRRSVSPKELVEAFKVDLFRLILGPGW